MATQVKTETLQISVEEEQARLENERRAMAWLVDPASGRVREDYVERQGCPVCRAGNETPLFERLGLAYARCDECGAVYISPRLRDDVLADHLLRRDNQEARFRELLERESSERRRHLMEEWLRLIRASVPRGKLLEIDCALGLFLEQARDSGYIVSGIEQNQLAAQHARSQGLMIYDVPLEQARLLSHSIDVVVLWSSLDRAQRPLELLGEIRRILNPRGRLFLTCRNLDSLFCQIFGLDKADWLRPPYQLNFYTPATLERLLASGGFRPLRIAAAESSDLERIRRYYAARAEERKSLPPLFGKILSGHGAEYDGLRKDLQDLLRRHRVSEFLMAECAVAE